MAFQPIVDCATGHTFAFEALVRGPNGEGAAAILDRVDCGNRYAFDQACRTRAIGLAAGLDLPAKARHLSINFLPNAVYRPELCIRSTLKIAEATGFPLDQIIFELTEGEHLAAPEHLKNIVESYRRMGFKTAIDDFGAAYSCLNLLAVFQPDMIKLDMQLIRDIDTERTKRVLVSGIRRIAADLDITVIAEGIETPGEHRALLDLGVTLQQGYLFARPGFEFLPESSAWTTAPGVADMTETMATTW